MTGVGVAELIAAQYLRAQLKLAADARAELERVAGAPAALELVRLTEGLDAMRDLCAAEVADMEDFCEEEAA